MNRVLAFEICAALEEDSEFAARMNVSSPAARVDLLNHYLLDRGIDAGDAQVLIVAYLAGSEHALQWMGRVLDRAEKSH